MWDGVAATNHHAGRPKPRRLQSAMDCGDDKVFGTRRHLPGALSDDLDDEIRIGGLDHDLVIEPQRQTHAVEAGTQVGAGSRHLGGAGQPGGQQSGHRRLRLSPGRGRPRQRPGRPQRV